MRRAPRSSKAFMQPLDILIREASTLPGDVALLATDETEVARQMQICNACRYCEGFCAVFPAMTRRLEFAKADIHYLANLCHNCGACLHACQYAPPHEFAVNVPLALARVRRKTYVDYAWPRAFGALYVRNGATLAVALAAGLAFFLVVDLFRRGTLLNPPLAGDFYAIFSHFTLVSLFGGVFIYATVALGIGVAAFWRNIAPPSIPRDIGPAFAEAAADVLRLKYLDGGHGEGCNEADDAFTLWRRRFHHFTFYGFALCFAATVVATIYDYGLGLRAPYAVISLPVLLGVAGGVGLMVGPMGLFYLNVRREAAYGDAAQKTMDRGFIALLLLTAVTGLVLLALRDTRYMALWLAIHLGVVMALLVTLPYGKFAHGVYRCAALLKWTLEKRRPTQLKLPD
jgi:citrate/tricarballylate utilization protein